MRNPRILGSTAPASWHYTALRAAPETRRQRCTIDNKDLSNVIHWFTLSLPEGLCVGVTTSSNNQFRNSLELSSALLPSASALHEEEYDWGQENFISDMSRTSFYLGRMALRSSLCEMLSNHNDEQARKFQDQIEKTPIRKDYFGRPILPSVVAGSISHKGNYAVGLSTLRFNDASCSIIDDKPMTLNWREECRIFSDEDDKSIVKDGSGTDQSSLVVGVGIDIERIHDKRSERIQRKILTEKELNELGSLEVILLLLLFLFSVYQKILN
jgi:phosphopantetheinyl transferase